jgi:hypothetical protein
MLPPLYWRELEATQYPLDSKRCLRIRVVIARQAPRHGRIELHHLIGSQLDTVEPVKVAE